MLDSEEILLGYALENSSAMSPAGVLADGRATRPSPIADSPRLRPGESAKRTTLGTGQWSGDGRVVRGRKTRRQNDDGDDDGDGGDDDGHDE